MAVTTTPQQDRDFLELLVKEIDIDGASFVLEWVAGQLRDTFRRSEMTMLRWLQQQAEELQNGVRNALREIRRLDTKGLDESEVMFRLEAIAGILRMALNDINGLVETWAHDLD